MKPVRAAAVLILATPVGCGERGAPPPAEPVTAAAVAADLRSLTEMTPGPVDTNPLLAWSCVGASEAEVNAARETLGPHAHARVTILMNDAAAGALAAGGPYPVGAVVVKDKDLLPFRSGDSPDGWIERGSGVGGMIKRAAGYDPAGGDWEYFYRANGGAVESGRMPNCAACHAGAAATDFVFGTWRAEPAAAD